MRTPSFGVSPSIVTTTTLTPTHAGRYYRARGVRYAASSAMVISSLRDGMNLVSFEWTVCQQHKPRPWNAGDAGREQGVLVLSEFAGAADHLDDGALLVNPYDTQTLADAMHNALSMPLSRRQALHKNAYEHVTTSTASTWAAKFVSALNRLHASNGLLPDAASNMAGLVAMLEQQPRIALLTDYDGTLTPIVSNPDIAKLGDDMRLLLRKIATLMPVAVVSGRSRGKVESFVRLPEVWVAGAHGFDISGPEGSGIIFRPAEQYREALRVAAAELRVVLATIPGSLVEDNDFAVSVHYRNVADDDVAAIDAAVEGTLITQPTLQRFPGKKVVELRPQVEWNKGKAVDFILQQLELERGGPIFPIYLVRAPAHLQPSASASQDATRPRLPLMPRASTSAPPYVDAWQGDDVSDEDAFAVLRQRGGLGILVSERMAAREQTAAAYRLSSPKAVLKLLTRLATARAALAEAPVKAGQPPK